MAKNYRSNNDFKKVNTSIVKNLIKYKYYGGIHLNEFKIPPTLSQKLEFKRMRLNSILNITTDLPQVIRGHYKLSKPAKIIEVVFSNDILFILNDSGLGVAYNKHNNKMLCILNRSPSETIRSLFYNKFNNTIVVAFHHDPSILNCTIFNIEDVVLKRNVSSNVGLEFQQIKIGNPGFIEFDDGNGRIVVADPQNDYFTFWDMKNYNKLYQIKGQNFLEMRISDGTVVFFRQPSFSTIEAHLCKISNGEYLEKTMVKLRSSLDIQFLELHREYLLLKQEKCSIRVWNLLTNTSKKISETRDFQPKAFIFFDQITDINNYTNFLTVSTDDISVWKCNNLGDVEIKFKITLPGIQTADCVNVCFSKGVILTYCNGLILENEEVEENNSLNESNYVPQFVQASKYFSNINSDDVYYREINNQEMNTEFMDDELLNNENNNTINVNSSIIKLSSTITGLLSESELEIGNMNYSIVDNINNNMENEIVGNQHYNFDIEHSIDSSYYDGMMTPCYPVIDNNYDESNTSLRRAIYIHSLQDGCKLGIIYCDMNDESEDIVLLHYDSDGMEIACGTNHGLIRRYKHSFEINDRLI